MIKHPYHARWAIPQGTRILIVGTAPPPRFDEPKMLRGNDFDFFYGSEDNYMWQYLDEIAEQIHGACLFNRTQVSVNGKKKIEFTDSSDDCCKIADAFLRRHHLWMRDVLDTYERKPGLAHSAADEAIIEPEPNSCTDFVSLLHSVPTIETLAFTSRLAAAWALVRLSDQLRSDKFAANLRDIKGRKTMRGKFWEGDILGRDLKFLLLPSPSGRAASPKSDVAAYRGNLFGV